MDYAATTPMDPRVVETMMWFLDCHGCFGNPASRLHSYGQQAEQAVNVARQQVADALHCLPDEIIWTSGATEANNLALQGLVRHNSYRRAGRKKHLITCKTEHRAVLDVAAALQKENIEVSYLDVDDQGRIDLNQLVDFINENTLLLSTMVVNNETGVIQDLHAIGNIVREHGILWHLDGAQMTGKMMIDDQRWQADLISVSGHKVYGPKGIGALYVRRGVRIQPQWFGGGQEKGLRPGTLPVHQIAGMGKAFALAHESISHEQSRMEQLREYFLKKLTPLSGLQVNGCQQRRVAGIIHVSIAGISAEALLTALRHDMAAATGSACSTGKGSHVIRAMGLDETMATIRFSLGRFSTRDDIDRMMEPLIETVNQLREQAPL